MDHMIGGSIYYFSAAVFMSLLLQTDWSNKKKLACSIFAFFGGFALILALCATSEGFEAVLSLYPLVVLAPLYLVFWFVSVHKGLKLLFTLLTASVLMMLPMLLGVVSAEFLDNELLMTIVALLSLAAILVLLIRYFRPPFLYILQAVDSKAYWLSICTIPLFYNAALYVIGLYNMKAETSVPVLFQLFLMLLTLAAYLLIMLTFTQIRRRSESERERDITRLQIHAAQENIQQMQTAQKQAAIYRHDFKHHIQVLHGYLRQKEYDQLDHYLSRICSELDAAVLTRYCKNSTVNLVLSAYAEKFAELGATFDVAADIPDHLHVEEQDLCVVLSNALANALHAAQKIGGKAAVSLTCKVKNNRLAISVENPYQGVVLFRDGLPVSSESGHGYGTQSIAAIAQKYSGVYTFTAQPNVFTFKIVL